jgi:hypothetical protein
MQPSAGLASPDGVAWGFARPADSVGVGFFPFVGVAGFVVLSGGLVGVGPS